MKVVVQNNHALHIIQAYKLDEPLSSFLSRYFRANKQIGANDRRFLRSLVYQYFRLGHAQKLMDQDQGLVIAHFLCQDYPTPFLEHWLPQYSRIPPDQVLKTKADKISMLREEGFPLSETNIFPLRANLSENIDGTGFIHSLLEQPPVYIRLLNSVFSEDLKSELIALDWTFEELAPFTFALTQNAPVQQLKAYQEGKITVMDKSVQKLADYLNVNEDEKWWDCCAGGGGKSLLLKALAPHVHLWVSDSRTSILKNHQKRIAQHGFQMADYVNADLEVTLPDNLPDFDAILLDAPCSGSGTWVRTPEGILQFNEPSLQDFQNKQIKLASNVQHQLKKGGSLFYITCSGFAQENEEVIQYIESHLPLQCLQKAYINGYERQAETLFVALLKKLD